MRIISLDPGRTTGAVVIHSDHIRTFEIPVDDGLNGIYQFLLDEWALFHEKVSWQDNKKDPFMIVYEDFLFRQNNTKVDYYPLQVIGVVNLFCERHYISVQSQNPSLKAFWLYNKGAKLKKLGLYEPGKRHAMDALSHGLYYVSFVMKRTDYIEKLKRK